MNKHKYLEDQASRASNEDSVEIEDDVVMKFESEIAGADERICG